VNDGPGSLGFMTRLVHAGEEADPAWGAVGVPIYQNATFAFAAAADIDALNAGEQDHYVYSRYSNPTVTALENKIADLEGAGAALATASGVAAISTAALQVAGSDGHIIASRSLYPVARSFFR
jgi:O-acetylhomoserine/O-acetylserine sulfhydrylase-like pyridoxal-dependent enzyme